MKRAGSEALVILEPMLRQIRMLIELTEKKPGIFYRKRDAFLHFHEDVTGLYADLKMRGDYVRFRVSTSAERKVFMAAAKVAAAS